jgi:hypothetical protein
MDIKHGDTGNSVFIADYEDVLTLFHWKDVEPFFSVFASELRKPNAIPHPIRIAAMIRKHEHSGFSNGMLLAIFWSGATTPGQGTGNARARLQIWGNSHLYRGQALKFLSLWNRDGDSHRVLCPVNPNESGFIDDAEWENLWSSAKSQAIEYNFAYVAVFDLQNLSPSKVAV